MSFRCPYTEVCRAQALREFADAPDLAAIFTQRLQCREEDSAKAHRCAVMLGLAEQEFPTFGHYVQAQRRAQQVPQGTLATQVGIDLQHLRDLELNKVDPKRLSDTLIERLATALSAPVAYLQALARLTSRAGTPRQGIVFARSIIDDQPESPH